MGLGRIVQMLKTSKEFDFVYKNSYKFRTEMLDICVLRTNLASDFFAKFRRLPCNLVGFSVSKKVGNAVSRNLIKRRLRAICREFFSNINSSLGMQFRTQSAESALDSADSQNLQGGLPRRFCESARNDNIRQNLICIFIAKSQILQTPFATLKGIIFDALKKQVNFRQDLYKKPRTSRHNAKNRANQNHAFQNPNYNPNKGAL